MNFNFTTELFGGVLASFLTVLALAVEPDLHIYEKCTVLKSAKDFVNLYSKIF
jgi:hypothetical protein